MNNKNNEPYGFSGLADLALDINTSQQKEYVFSRLDKVLPKRDVIKISSFKQLCKIGRNNAYPLYGHYELTRDIDASPSQRMNEGHGFEPIGNEANRFTGIFDGKGLKITGLYINRPQGSDVGLFGYIDGEDDDVDAKIIGVDLYLNAVVGKSEVGGLVGNIGCGNITNCRVTGDVEGKENIGGLVGINAYGYITNCCANVVVKGIGSVGGLVGYSSGNITNCYADGNVSGNDCVGGLVGYDWGLRIICCYANAVVNGSYNVGGLLGLVYNGDDGVTSCFWDINVSGITTSAGGVGKTTAEMKQQYTYENWDFDNVWQISVVGRPISEKGYPYLRALI
jgi:hypothetical protein